MTAKKLVDGKKAETHNGFSLISNEKLKTMYAEMVAWEKRAKDGGGQPFPRGMAAVAVAMTVDLGAKDFVAAPPPMLAALAAVNSLPRFAADVAPAVDGLRKSRAKIGKPVAVVFALDDREEDVAELVKRATAAKAGVLVVRCVDESALTKAEAKSKAPVFDVDVADAVAIYRVATECLAHARRGSGPAVVRAVRFRGAEPVATMKAYLQRKGL